jgi:YjbE family integral membrane protein
MDLSLTTGMWDWVILSQILGVNIVLSGDNAVLIALAAAGLPAEQRTRAIMFGMVMAVVLRLLLSVVAVQLLAIPGLLLLGGGLLLWIAWGFFKELRSKQEAEEGGARHAPGEVKTMVMALRQIVIADVSMSLDNVLAVAGAAGGNMLMLMLGLSISILLMGVAATLISRLLDRYRWVAYVGVALISYIGIKMINEDAHRLYDQSHATLQQPAVPATHTAVAVPIRRG